MAKLPHLPLCAAALLVLFLADGACASAPTAALTLASLDSGSGVTESGQRLMDLPMGLHKIAGSQDDGGSVVVAVHGYKSRGYEWVHFLKTLGKNQSVYFYRWNWDSCPGIASKQLAQQLDRLAAENPTLELLVVAGHSLGGVVVAETIGKYSGRPILYAHAIAAPLASTPLLTSHCSYRGPTPVALSDKRQFRQWHTQHHLDGAYKDLPMDPQQVQWPGSKVTKLPENYKGHRLGHNWSVSAVADILATPVIAD